MAHSSLTELQSTGLYKEELHHGYSDLSGIPELRRKFLEYCRDNPDADECRLYED